MVMFQKFKNLFGKKPKETPEDKLNNLRWELQTEMDDFTFLWTMIKTDPENLKIYGAEFHRKSHRIEYLRSEIDNMQYDLNKQ